MTSTRLIFLRHADTLKDPTVHAAEWGLSEQGKVQAEAAAHNPVMQQVDSIYVSEETKTFLTVEPLLTLLGKEATPLPAFNEVARGEKFLSKEEFEAEKTRQLLDLSYKAFNGESGEEALIRFKQGVEQVIQDSPGKTVLIVTHGTVLNIYFAALLGRQQSLPQRWSHTDFCAYGIVEDGKVIKDIISSPTE